MCWFFLPTPESLLHSPRHLSQAMGAINGSNTVLKICKCVKPIVWQTLWNTKHYIITFTLK
jgi:hypothetical protein